MTKCRMLISFKPRFFFKLWYTLIMQYWFLSPYRTIALSENSWQVSFWFGQLIFVNKYWFHNARFLGWGFLTVLHKRRYQRVLILKNMRWLKICGGHSLFKRVCQTFSISRIWKKNVVLILLEVLVVDNDYKLYKNNSLNNQFQSYKTKYFGPKQSYRLWRYVACSI